MRYVFGCVVAVCLAVPVVQADKEDKPLTPAEAIKMVNKEVKVEMVVRPARTPWLIATRSIWTRRKTSATRRTWQLSSPNTAQANSRMPASRIPAEHFRGKTIRVTGTVTLKDDRPRIEVSDPEAIKVIEKKK